MTTFSEKYTSNLTNSTMNRGVEAKEADIANTLGERAAETGRGSQQRQRRRRRRLLRVLCRVLNKVRCVADGEGAESRSGSEAATTPRDCASYLQVRAASPAPAPQRRPH